MKFLTNIWGVIYITVTREQIWLPNDEYLRYCQNFPTVCAVLALGCWLLLWKCPTAQYICRFVQSSLHRWKIHIMKLLRYYQHLLYSLTTTCNTQVIHLHLVWWNHLRQTMGGRCWPLGSYYPEQQFQLFNTTDNWKTICSVLWTAMPWCLLRSKTACWIRSCCLYAVVIDVEK